MQLRILEMHNSRDKLAFNNLEHKFLFTYLIFIYLLLKIHLWQDSSHKVIGYIRDRLVYVD